MASISREYLIKKEKVKESAEKAAEGTEAALNYGTSINLVPLLISTNIGIDRLPVFHFFEGKA